MVSCIHYTKTSGIPAIDNIQNGVKTLQSGVFLCSLTFYNNDQTADREDWDGKDTEWSEM